MAGKLGGSTLENVTVFSLSFVPGRRELLLWLLLVCLWRRYPHCGLSFKAPAPVEHSSSAFKAGLTMSMTSFKLRALA